MVFYDVSNGGVQEITKSVSYGKVENNKDVTFITTTLGYLQFSYKNLNRFLQNIRTNSFNFVACT